MRRIIAIGDIHGCARELEELLNKIKLQEQDHILFMGDLVNRGPDTQGVFDQIHELDYKTTCILGNHERRLLRYKKKKDISQLKAYERKTLKLFRPKDWQLMEDMKLYVYKKKLDTLFLHGGLLPNTHWSIQSPKVITTIQVIDEQGRPFKGCDCEHGTPWAKLWKGPPFVVYGHSPTPEPKCDTWALGIDTACVYGGKLTAYILPEKQIIQVSAHTTYVRREYIINNTEHEPNGPNAIKRN